MPSMPGSPPFRTRRSLRGLSCLVVLTVTALAGRPQEASLQIQGGAGSARIEFTGTLRAASRVEGPFVTLPGASSPYVLDALTDAARYWRTRRRDVSGDPNDLAQTFCASGGYSIAIQEDGRLWAWPPSSSVTLPAALMPGTQWKAVSSLGGFGHTLAIDASGELWSWGANRGGELGIGAVFSSTNLPQHVMPGTHWNWVSTAPGVSMAIQSDGSLWSWGTNRFHRLGYDAADSSPSPSRVGIATGWARVSAGYQHVLAIRSDGSLWAWGANASGQLGAGPKTDRVTPEPLADPGPWVSISATPTLSLAVRGDQTLWWWGTLAPGTGLAPSLRTTNAAPTQLAPERPWKAVASGIGGCCAALAADGSLWAWGANDVSAPLIGDRAVAGTNAPRPLETNQVWRAVSLGADHGLALRSDGTLWGWGNYTAMGDGASGQAAAFLPAVLSSTDSSFERVSTRFRNNHALDTHGRLWAWGQQQDFWSPQPQVIAEGCFWTTMACGYGHGLGLDQSGQLWSWGDNQLGELGNGLPPDTGTPISHAPAIVPGATWSFIACGGSHSIGIQSDGSLWTWGANDTGQLGIGSVGGPAKSPQRVLAGTHWRSAAAGEAHTLAIDAEGHLWAWGRNDAGQLGNNSTQRSPIPVRVGDESTWKVVAAGISHSLAIREDGTLWGWGQNDRFEAGPTPPAIGAIGLRQPTLISSDTDWSAIGGGLDHSLGLKTNGTLWAWGPAPNYELGNNATTPGVPAPVAGNHRWKALAAGNTFSLGLRQDGTLMAWGNGSTGQLGLSPLRPVLGGDVWSPGSP